VAPLLTFYAIGDNLTIFINEPTGKEGKMARLLIVDDELDVREFAANFFRKRKIEVITAASGEEALSIMEKQNADLVLLDIKMDGMDGLEALRRIKDIDKNAKVIMVTGRKPDEEGAFEKCRQIGALDYIHKPLELDELEKIVMKTMFQDKK
jgi:two-component system response regulator (stage 0 sporulation protein F)